MSKIIFLLILLVLSGITSISIIYAHSFFTNSATNIANSFAAAATFPTSSITTSVTPTISSTPTSSPSVSPTISLTPTVSPVPGHIVINEVFPSSDNNNEWVELFNPTSNAINISGWKIMDNNTADIFATPSAIPANGYAILVSETSNVVFATSSSVVKIILSGVIGNGLGSTGDVLKLFNGPTIVDQMSFGDNHSVFAAPPAFPTPTKSIARHPNGVDTDSASDWLTNQTTSIGASNP